MKFLFAIAISVSFLILASCGKDICYAGFVGNCTVPPNPNPPVDALQMSPAVAGVYTTSIRLGEQMTLRVTGGKPAYFPRQTAPTGCADVNSANLIVTPQFPGDCTITIVDSSTPSLYGNQTITVLPR